MKRSLKTSSWMLAAIGISTTVWWGVRPEPEVPTKSVPSNPASPQLGPSVTGQLENVRVSLIGTLDAAHSLSILSEFRRFLQSLPPQEASRELRAYLASGRDAPTRLELTIEAGGRLANAPSLRVFALDYLGQIDLVAAGVVAIEILSKPESPDEWAVSLRNYAWAHPGVESHAFLTTKARELITNANWLARPTAGTLEAFDVIVYARATSLAPELSALARDKGNRAAGHAAYLTLDRLAMAEPALLLEQLVTNPSLLSGREETMASLVARADVRNPDQRALVERYMLDERRASAELSYFAGIFPNANVTVSPNLLTATETLDGERLAARDRATLQIIRQWQADPRFARLAPVLSQMHARVSGFVR